MNKTDLTFERILDIAERNFFDDFTQSIIENPLILVIRNSDKRNLIPISDTGSNCCDAIFLVSLSGIIPLQGRTIPHEKYQAQMVAGTNLANRIATGFYPGLYRRGKHRGHEALVPGKAFVFLRSTDMILGNEDDYPESYLVADNFHGSAPYSAGCISVIGKMNPPTDDWALAHNWVYRENKNATRFSSLVLEHSDLRDNGHQFRIGSVGYQVSVLQRALGIEPDGDFGPITFYNTRRFQIENKLLPTGVIGAVESDLIYDLAGERIFA